MFKCVWEVLSHDCKHLKGEKNGDQASSVLWNCTHSQLINPFSRSGILYLCCYFIVNWLFLVGDVVLKTCFQGVPEESMKLQLKFTSRFAQLSEPWEKNMVFPADFSSAQENRDISTQIKTGDSAFWYRQVKTQRGIALSSFLLTDAVTEYIKVFYVFSFRWATLTLPFL